MLGLVLAIAGSSTTVYVSVAGDLRETKTKVDQNERRILEDRQASTIDRREIKNDVKQIGSDVQIILRKLDAQDAREKERAERLRRERNGGTTQ